METAKAGQTSYHNTTWWFCCPCAGTLRRAFTTKKTYDVTTEPTQIFDTILHKDSSINIGIKNLKSVQTGITTVIGTTKRPLSKPRWLASLPLSHFPLPCAAKINQLRVIAPLSTSYEGAFTMVCTKWNGTGNTITTTLPPFKTFKTCVHRAYCKNGCQKRSFLEWPGPHFASFSVSRAWPG